jgi:uncharacterized protein DUF3263
MKRDDLAAERASAPDPDIDDLLDGDADADTAEAEQAETEQAETEQAETEQVETGQVAEVIALDERGRRILAFEKQWWRQAGSKEQAIRDTFELSSTRYYQLLNGLLDNPAALERDPVLVGRLRRLRSTRARTRRR